MSYENIQLSQYVSGINLPGEDFRAKAEELVSAQSKESAPLIQLHQPNFNLTKTAPCKSVLDILASVTTKTESKAHAYQPSSGQASHRQMVAKCLSTSDYEEPYNDVFLTYGESHGLNLVIIVSCNPGDIILVPSPGDSVVLPFTQLFKVVLKEYKVHLDGTVDMGSLEECLKSCERKPKLLLAHELNPLTGKSLKNTKELVDWCAKQQILLNYECSYTFSRPIGTTPFEEIMALASPNFPLIVVFDMSKDIGYTAATVGFIAFIDKGKMASPISEALGKIMEVVLAPCSLMCILFESVLIQNCCDIWRKQMNETLQSNAVFMVSQLHSAIPGLKPLSPDYGYSLYIEVDMKQYPSFANTESLCLKLLEEERLQLAPTCLYTDANPAIRMLLSGEKTLYEEVILRLKRFFGNHHQNKE